MFGCLLTTIVTMTFITHASYKIIKSNYPCKDICKDSITQETHRVKSNLTIYIEVVEKCFALAHRLIHRVILKNYPL